MSVIKQKEWNSKKPKWSKFSNYGLYKLKKGESESDYHYHDCDEYFIVTEGKADLLLEDLKYEISPGDCVCILKGGRHQIINVSEDLTLVWIYDELKAEKRKGHISYHKEREKREIILPVRIVKMGHWDEQKPYWSRLTNYGIVNFPKGKVGMDYEHHDCHEYYFVTKGSLLVLIDKRQFKCEVGDVACIPKGNGHRILESFEDSTIIWLQDELKGEKGEVISTKI